MCFTFTDTTFENNRRSAAEYQSITRQIRSDIIKSLALAGSGHPGGALGITDMLAVLYFGGYMRYDATNPHWEGRDRFVLSAGHYAPVLYSCLARAGYFSASELATLRKLGSHLQGHPSGNNKCGDNLTPGNETASGSLGQGISIAVGMAISDKCVDQNDHKVFCMTGDGELQEGLCWEAAMSASMYKLDNLCWILDSNDCQIDGRVKDVMSIYPLREKFEAFGFSVVEVNGNDLAECIHALDTFTDNHKTKIGMPTCIIAHTKMGHGVSFMEDNYHWHGNPPNLEQAKEALLEIGEE
jgi:transketolase